LVFISRNPAAFSVNPSGRVTALAVDSGYIVIQGDAKVDSIRVIVSQTVSSVVQLQGDNQVATVNQNANDSLGIVVRDANGHGVANAEVTWTTPDSGVVTVAQGVYTSAIGFRPMVMPPLTSRTNAEGIAKAKWQLGKRAGAQAVVASRSADSRVPARRTRRTRTAQPTIRK
jgi:hypothetical protein